MRFSRFAWAVLGYNILVILWGAFVRATGSGAGCGSHWPLCNGVVVPRSPSTETLIEFGHRITSGLALAGVAALWIWARKRFPAGHKARKYALLSVAFILVEAALGAGLVLFDLVGQNASYGRAVYLAAHLANTLILLGVLTATAWHSGPERPAPMPRPRSIAFALPVLMLVCITGAVAALGDTLYPAASLAHGVGQDVAAESPTLLRLRIVHPFIAVAGGLFLLSVATTAARLKLGRAAWAAFLLVLAQIIAGAINIALLAPVWMQILHLFLATLLWISLVVVQLRTAAGVGKPLRAAAR